MFVIIYTPGPAWLAGKSVFEQPFYREHGRYMHQLFVDKRLLMGGPFLDNQGALGILDVASVAQALEIVERDPAVLAQFVEAHVHPWQVAFNQYPAQSSKLGA
jgi:uncharacterized protein YciI